MDSYAARAFIERTQALLQLAAEGHLTQEQALSLLELEEEAIRLLDTEMDSLYIILADGRGPSGDPRRPDYNSIVPVERVEKREVGKGTWTATEYTAYSKDGDWCRSGPEGVIDGRPYGAASALVARLLEARAAGVV